MRSILEKIDSPLFDGIQPDDLRTMLGCIGFHISTYKKGETLAFEQEHIQHIGILISGAVDMVKEDIWGNRTLLLRMGKNDVFGETFACGTDSSSVVSFIVSENSQILFMSFSKVMHTCSCGCVFHHRLISNMVRVIADKNRNLMGKVEVISKKTLREKILAYLSIQAQTAESRYFQVPLGRVELAEYLCADRSALTRELSRMKEDGLIDFDKNWFRIL